MQINELYDVLHHNFPNLGNPTGKVGGFPGGSDGKESACIVGDLGLFSALGRSPWEGNGYALQYSCLVNSMDRGAWRATVHGVAKSQTGLSDFHFLFFHHNFTFPDASYYIFFEAEKLY